MSKIENAEMKDANPPLKLVEQAIEDQHNHFKTNPVPVGKSVVYWMRMNDLRGELDRLLLLPPLFVADCPHLFSDR